MMLSEHVVQTSDLTAGTISKKEDRPCSLILLLSTVSKMLQIQFAICNFYLGATRDEVF